MMSFTKLFSFAYMITILMAVSESISCVREAGKVVIQDEDGNKVSNTPFYCLRVTAHKTNDMVAILKSESGNKKICTVRKETERKDKIMYSKAVVSTGLLCTYKCSESAGKYKCIEKMSAGDSECTCKEFGPRVLAVPIAGGSQVLGGQSDVMIGSGSKPGEESCDGKEEGHEFINPVPCSSLRAEVKRKRVKVLPGRRYKCAVVESRVSEVRYTPTTRMEGKQLQGCKYVCKKSSLRCIEDVVDGECRCRSFGMSKVLVGMPGDEEVSGRLDQKKCKVGQCGACGWCDEKTGWCVLHMKAHEGNYCECGKICPSFDVREKEFRGGQIPCKENVSLNCGGGEKEGKKYLRGTKIADFCNSGEFDNSDVCSCRDGYEKVLEADSENVECRKKESLA